VRTPKFKITSDKHSWQDKKYLTKKISISTIIEVFLTLYCSTGVVLAIAFVQIAALPFQLMFAFGFGMISFLSIRQVVLYNRAVKNRIK
jgi:hypothetical protein